MVEQNVLWSCVYSFANFQEIVEKIGDDSVARAGELFMEFVATPSQVKTLSFVNNVKEV